MFVMAISSVPDDIHEDVALELLAVFNGQADGLVHEFGLVGVHVDDGSHAGFGYVGAVETGSGFSGGCGETDLVVSNHVDHTRDLVAVELLHLEGLVADALASQCCITVNQHPESLLALFVLEIVSNCANISHKNTINRLQVRWISQDT